MYSVRLKPVARPASHVTAEGADRPQRTHSGPSGRSTECPRRTRRHRVGRAPNALRSAYRPKPKLGHARQRDGWQARPAPSAPHRPTPAGLGSAALRAAHEQLHRALLPRSGHPARHRLPAQRPTGRTQRATACRLLAARAPATSVQVMDRRVRAPAPRRQSPRRQAPAVEESKELPRPQATPPPARAIYSARIRGPAPKRGDLTPGTKTWGPPASKSSGFWAPRPGRGASGECTTHGMLHLCAGPITDIVTR